MDTTPAVDRQDWIVINTHPHREALALANLTRQQFKVYCPMIWKRIRHARKTHDAKRPLFPGYVFVTYASAVKRWRPIWSTYGIRAVVQSGDSPSLLNGRFIEALQARETDGIIHKPETPFKLGQQISVESGPFAGLVGTILETRENERHVVLMDWLKSSVKVQIQQTTMRAISPPAE